MRRFGILLKKEIKELLTVQILLPLLIATTVFMLIGNMVGSEQEKTQDGGQSIMVVDLDRSDTSAAILDGLEAAGMHVDLFDGSVDELVEELTESDGSTALTIPEGFEESLASSEARPVETYTVIRTFSLLGLRGTGTVGSVLWNINRSVSDRLISEAAPGMDSDRLRDPVTVVETVIVGKNRTSANAGVVSEMILQQTFIIPVVIFMVIVFSAQMVATTIAAEKENKTLETLLSAPVSRSAIVTAKMMAAGIVALMAAVVIMFGMRYYLEGMMGSEQDLSAMGSVLEDLGLTLGAGDYALLGVTLFLGILCVLAVALILGALVDNVRAAGLIMAPLMIVVGIPYVLVLFLDLNTLAPAVRYFVMAIPFSYPFMAAPNLFLDNYAIVWFGIAYEAVCFIVFVSITARFFSSDRILTMKLRLGKKSR